MYLRMLMQIVSGNADLGAGKVGNGLIESMAGLP